MSPLPVQFEYATGLRRSPFTAATLVGGWDDAGRPTAGAWTAQPMRRGQAADGSDAFHADVAFDDGALGADLAWGVLVRREGGEPEWGIPAEVADLGRTAQERTFTLRASDGAPQRESYRLSHHRARGARPLAATAATRPVRFTVWAPNARAVEVVFGGDGGYIADDGTGADPARAPLAMQRDPFGMWTALGDDFAAALGSSYMYRVTCDDGRVVYRTDMYSLQQRGGGAFDPGGRPYDGDPSQLDGSPSCTVVVDPDSVGDEPEDEFWAGELDPARPVPRRVEDLVIYELHVGALAPHTHAAGTLADALALLPYLEALGVNAVELLPMFEFNGSSSWGYGNSHLLAIEKSAGGRDALKRFVRACHRQGIAVLMDVVYNHWTEDATRSAWQVDSTANERNIYYWYEAPQSRYPTPDGGYVDNISSGWAPRYFDPHVRELFVSSTAMLIDEFHIDGLRVDQTTSMHAYNTLHADGSPLGSANVFGRKTLRELCQTLKTIAPDCMLIAEDHSHWSEVTRPAAQGGIGFDAVWYADFYHHLIGDTDHGPSYARLLHAAARDHDGPLKMTAFAGALAATVSPSVVYVESHDEAGAGETDRTIVAAVDGAPLVGPTRAAAEARVRFVAGMSMLSAGTPMFLMGEEVGAQQKYTYDHFSEHKEDLVALRDGDGAALFAFYAALIALRLDEPALRSRRLEVLHVHDANRVIAFRRSDGAGGELLVVASLNEHPYDAPDYRIAHDAIADGAWRERLNSDATAFGGDGVGNGAGTLHAAGGSLGVVVPAMGFVVLERA